MQKRHRIEKTDKYEQMNRNKKKKSRQKNRVCSTVQKKIRTSKNREIVHMCRMRLGEVVGLVDLRFLLITGISSEASAYELMSDSGEDVADQNS